MHVFQFRCDVPPTNRRGGAVGCEMASLINSQEPLVLQVIQKRSRILIITSEKIDILQLFLCQLLISQSFYSQAATAWTK